MDDDEDFKSRKKKGRGGGFWDAQKILVLLIFLIGLVIGAVIANQFIDPYLNSSVSNQNQELLTINQELDSVNDQYYSCLLKNNVDPQTCVQ